VEESFGDVIRHHLDLKQRNAALEKELPIDEYKDERRSAFDTADWSAGKDELWSSPVFDWGDEAAEP
jgi:hypothetical protein